MRKIPSSFAPRSLAYSWIFLSQWRRFRLASGGGGGGRNRPSSFGHSSGEANAGNSSVASFLVWGGGASPQMYRHKKKSYTCNLNMQRAKRASASETYRPLFSHMVWRYKRQYRTKHCMTLRKSMNKLCERARSERAAGNFSRFHILKLLFPSIFCWYFWYFISETHIFSGLKITSSLYIQSMQFPVITYGMALYINDSYVYRQNTNIEKIYVYASERSERA